VGTLLSDLRYGVRMLWKNPAFAVVAILTLALGVGANTAIFSVENAALLRPLPYKDGARLVRMRETSKRVSEVSVSYPDFLDWRQQSSSFARMVAVHNVGFNLSGVDKPESIGGYGVSPGFLSTLGVQPILGRDFLPAEESAGTEPVVLLSYQLWQSHWGSSPGVLGRSIVLDGRSFSIVGVLTPSFRFLDKTDVLTPMGVFAKDLMDRGDRGDMDVVARLKPGVTFDQARAEMNTIAARLAKQYPLSDSGVGVSMSSMREVFVGDMRPALLVLLAAVMLVLLVACANVANLFLARGAARAREIAVRLAFGASRGRIIRQMLTESFLFAALGGALGLILGAWSLRGLRELIAPDFLDTIGVRMDGGVFWFTGGLVVLVTVAFGLAPALQATRPDVQESLKEGGRGSTPGAGQHRLRGALVIAEMALSVVLLAGAGLMMKSLYRLLQVNPGFQPESVVQMEMVLRSAQYSKNPAILGFWEQVLDRVRALPGVEAAALGTAIPLAGNHNRGDITIEGQPLPAPGEFPHPDFHEITPDYMRVLGIPLLRGRTFTEADNETAPPVALINAALAHRFWPNQDPIGKQILFGHPGPKSKPVTIVGVVGDTRLYGLANPARFEVYDPYRQDPSNDMNLVVRSALNPAGLIPDIRSAVAAVDKDQPIFGVATMKKLVDDSVSTRRSTLILLGLFSALALILAGIGIYGVIAYIVTERTHEIGIRVAVGAERGDVLRLILGYGARLALWGVAVGLAAALGLMRLLSSLLFAVSASDPLTFAAVSVVLVVVALMACYVPARRALEVDPMVALRHE
jgi:predicted permease